MISPRHVNDDSVMTLDRVQVDHEGNTYAGALPAWGGDVPFTKRVISGKLAHAGDRSEADAKASALLALSA